MRHEWRKRIKKGIHRSVAPVREGNDGRTSWQFGRCIARPNPRCRSDAPRRSSLWKHSVTMRRRTTLNTHSYNNSTAHSRSVANDGTSLAWIGASTIVRITNLTASVTSSVSGVKLRRRCGSNSPLAGRRCVERFAARDLIGLSGSPGLSDEFAACFGSRPSPVAFSGGISSQHISNDRAKP